MPLNSGQPSRVDSKNSGVPRVAVLAVHGVGDHKQFQTAREIGDLLSNLKYVTDDASTGSGAEPRYAPFTETVQRINVTPVKVSSRTFPWGAKEKENKTWGPMDALAQAQFRGELQMTGEDNAQASLDHLFMEGQLVDYRGERPEDTYQLLRLEGRRVPPVAAEGSAPAAPAADTAGQIASDLKQQGITTPQERAHPTAKPEPSVQERIVHVYEMYWADLSGLGDAFTRIFSELYQILFHLGSVGVNNVRAAAIAARAKGATPERRWRRFARAEASVAMTLAWPIPILNLLIAALLPAILIACLMRTYLSARQEFVALEAFTGLLVTVGSAYALSRIEKLSRIWFLLPLPIILVLCIAVGLAAPQLPRDGTEIAAVVLFGALGLGAVFVIMQAYDKNRPGSLRAAIGITALVAVACILVWVSGRWTGGAAGYPAITGCLNVIEAAFFLLSISWALFYLCYAWAHIAGWHAASSIKDQTDTRWHRTRWTAQLVLALPSCLFIVLTLAVWAGVLNVAVLALPGQENVAATAPQPALDPELPCHGPGCVPVFYKPIGMFRPAHPHAAILASDWANRKLRESGAAFYMVLLPVMAFCVLFTAWALLPSVVDEFSPPQSDPLPEGTSDAALQQLAARLNRESKALGVWLDRGFRLLKFPGKLLYWAILATPLLVLLTGRYAGPSAQTFYGVLGTIMAGAAVGIFGFGGRLKKLALGFRPVVRVMLDVDNWLREHPRDSNPTARICGRYVSLLRHILDWKDGDGKPYDALVVIAHSQGTVITADLLRFLNAELREAGPQYDPELAPLGTAVPVYLFTMGSPLRQLYSLRFPFLYGWARSAASNGSRDLPDIDGKQMPAPDKLGVEQWVNAYRSGDYIGRYLWRPEGCGYEWEAASAGFRGTWDPPAGKPKRVSSDAGGTRIEFCIGPGAHTHYWDHSAQLIAEVLDRLIVAAPR